MKAIVWTAYGPPQVLQLREVEKPVPKDNQVLIKIHATGVFAGDCEMRAFKIPMASLWLPLRLIFGLFKPRGTAILGQEWAGEVESMGKDVSNFTEGDQVYGCTDIRFSAYAQYICLAADGPIVNKPRNMSYEEAAVMPTGGVNALHFLRKGNIQPGEKVLINGAAGSIGTIAVQIAKSMGAEVTAVDSGDKLPMLQSIGADHVIDYTQQDFVKNGQTYDVIFDVVGKSPYGASLKSLNPKGRYLLGNTKFPQMFRSAWTNRTSDKKVSFAFADLSVEKLNALKTLIEAGKVKAVIDKSYTLEQMVDAHRYVDSGRKCGHVVVSVGHDGK